ncbi:DUF1592 domain-containing protein [bacterium]|nr:DUF1592 domain-containing protein [bacterium]
MIFSRPFCLAIGLWGLAPLAAAELPSMASLEIEIRPFLATYCIACHDGAEAKGGVLLDDIPTVEHFATHRRQWNKVIAQIRAKGMPPADEDQPTDAERAKIVEWLTTAVNHVDCSGDRPPGKPTLRRLNRVEYNNTIRDLLAIDFRPADDFPADDVGEGFDNIGDVLSISPLLLEKYLEASQKIAERAIVVPQPTQNLSERIEGEGSRSTSKGQTVDDGKAQLMTTPGELYRMIKFPESGEYHFRLRAYGQQVGNEPARAGIKIDDQQPHLVDVTAVAEQPGEYDVSLRVEKGKRRVAIAFVNDLFDEAQQQDRNLIVDYLQIDGPTAVDKPITPASHAKVFFQPIRPDHEAEDLRQIIDRFTSRAFRRPATPNELDRLEKLIALARRENEPFERGVQLVVEAVLASPHFLFKMEADNEPDSAQPRELNDFELATRLSYFLWSTMPDDVLWQQALEGTLREPANFEKQVERMLADDRVLGLVENFAGQWLQLRNLADRSPDRDKFPMWNDQLRSAMRRETELFFASVLRERRQLVEFLDANYTFVNEPLAKHYGIEGIAGEEFRRVELTGQNRGGLLTQASILTITSDPTRTSPVKRGKWVMETILGTPPASAPPNVPELDKQRLTGTLRQRMEQHRVNPACATCHDTMDPLGFGLENFDAIGGWRDRDGEYPVDASGKLPDGSTFVGPKQLAQILTQKKDLFLRTVTERMLVYALGRGLEVYDECEVREIVERVSAKGGVFADLVKEITQSRPFRFRNG